MENPYIKQFPDLMAGKKVMYVHGFGSSAQSGTVHRLREVLCNATIIAEDVPLHPQEAITMLRELCEREKPDLIIGTSMGGMYAEMLYGYDRILINPALAIGDTMVTHGLTGAQHFFNPRKDGIQDFIVTKAMVKEYKEITTHCFSGLNDEERRRVVGLFGDRDDLVHTYDLFHDHYPTAIWFHGEHRMDDHSYMQSVMPVIRWIDDRQRGYDRPVVYVTTDTLISGGVAFQPPKDPSSLNERFAPRKMNQPRPSAQKAFRRLIETYNVYVVAPMRHDDRKMNSDIMEWIEEYINVPAYNHTIFCNQPELLIGDFLISQQPCESFMGTVIQHSSDTFKTWEEILTYFERLNP